jgi:hypothetical protein
MIIISPMKYFHLSLSDKTEPIWEILHLFCINLYKLEVLHTKKKEKA